MATKKNTVTARARVRLTNSITGKQYKPGDLLEDLTPEQIEAAIKVKAAYDDSNREAQADTGSA